MRLVSTYFTRDLSLFGITKRYMSGFHNSNYDLGRRTRMTPISPLNTNPFLASPSQTLFDKYKQTNLCYPRMKKLFPSLGMNTHHKVPPLIIKESPLAGNVLSKKLSIMENFSIKLHASNDHLENDINMMDSMFQKLSISDSQDVIISNKPQSSQKVDKAPLGDNEIQIMKLGYRTIPCHVDFHSNAFLITPAIIRNMRHILHSISMPKVRSPKSGREAKW